MPEDTCSREVVSGSLWTGDVFGHFIFKRGNFMDSKKLQGEVELSDLETAFRSPYLDDLLEINGPWTR